MELPVPLRRLAYRSAYAGLRLYWWVARPSVSGVKCVLTDQDQVLLVRHTYGPRDWDLPGGSRKRGEAPERAATREMHEELGIWIDRWHKLGQMDIEIDHRRDRLNCLQAEVHAPELSVDLGELAAAQWFDRAELPGQLGRYTRRILALLGE